MQNFGKIKNAFNDILAEAIVSKDPKGKVLFQKYLKMLKESKILKTQFSVYNELEKKICDDSFTANIFLSENVKLLDKFTKKEILAENQKLGDLLINEGFATFKSYDSKMEALHESISSLIFNSGDVNSITENRVNIVNYIKENKQIERKEAIGLPLNMIGGVMVNKFNAKYSTLDESEKKMLKAIISADDSQKIELHESLVGECLNAVNESLKTEEDIEVKSTLLAVKVRLLESKPVLDDSFNSNVCKLIELKKSLTE